MPSKKSKHWFLDEDGNWTRQDDFYEWLRTMQALFADGKVKVSIERPTRTLRQNSLLWAAVYPAIHKGLRDAGVTELHLMGDDGEALTLPITVDTIHKIMKAKYLTPDEPGEEPTTTTLSTTEFSRYVENIRFDDWVQRHEIHIPLPDTPPIDAYE